MSSTEIPLIPRKLLFGNPDKTQARLSPDGAKLSYLAPVNGVLNVWVGPVESPEAARPVTNDTNRGIRFHEWAYTGKHVLYIQDKGGDENWRIYGVDLEIGQVTDYTPIEKVAARIESISPRTPEKVVIALNDRNEQLHDLHILDLKTGERTLLIQNDEGFLAYTVDDKFRVRMGSRMTPDGGMDIMTRKEDNTWEIFAHVPMEDMLTTQLFGFDESGRYLYLADSRERNTSALVQYDTQANEFKVMAEDSRADLSGVIIHPTERRPQAVSFTYDRRHWQILDPSIQPDLDFLATVANGEIDVVSRTLDDQHWIVAYTLDNSPLRYYRYERAARQTQFLFSNRKDLEDKLLVSMQPVIIKSRDGLDLVSYITLPAGSDSTGTGRPARPLPMVLFVHGGPWGRDGWGFNPYHQWLANRGYAVLSVNFRASTGLGKAFTNAGNMEWGAAMHNDLLDAVDWAVKEGIADKDSIAIMGGSYGGYATLAGLTFTPDVFACGVDIVGPSNLITLLETIPPYWTPMLEMLTSRMGDHRTDEGREFLKSRSPLTFADRIRKPLLIGQGANDPRVKQAESDQIVQAMQSKSIPVIYVLYPDEGHGFARPENNMSFSAVAEAFLARILEGRCEPIGDDFAGASITVPTGAEQVSGLAEALKKK
ncbi:MAG TPA: S9 family peptidase [Anaerolineales bacterium]|nr:S9 family peptidase [Anaerolineales bacterium]